MRVRLCRAFGDAGGRLWSDSWQGRKVAVAHQRAAVGLRWVNDEGAREVGDVCVWPWRWLLQGLCLSGLLPLSQGVDVMSFLPES